MSYRSLLYNGHFGIINSEIEITAHEMSEAHIRKDVVCNSLANFLGEVLQTPEFITVV